MTTRDVLKTLEAHGWRYEAQGKGLQPLLTNAPDGQQFCQACGWQPRAAFDRQGAMCHACVNNTALGHYYQQKGRHE